MSYFVYRSLTPHKKRIRLVNVLPETHYSLRDNTLDQHHGGHDLSDSSSPISCTVTHVSLDNAPAYTALSYNWGDPSQCHSILVNGARFTVTVNLEAALRQLRLADEPLTLWIDALCIDQNDEVEKSEQLDQMRQIYSQARSVIAWLGPAADNSDIAVQWVEQYGGRSFELGIGMKPELRLRYLLDNLEATGKDVVDGRLREFIRDLKDQLSPANVEYADLINSLYNVFKRAYWSRIWVVQELASASTVKFMCGNRTVTEHSLDHALRLVRNFRQYRLLQEKNDAPIVHSHGLSIHSITTGNPINLLKFRKAAGPSPLIHLMRSFRFFQATDPRDKVFALLGIAQDTQALGLRPDYRKSCEDVYTDLAWAFIRNGYIEILSLCELPKQIAGLPSWVHDWSLMNRRSPLQQRALDRSAQPITTILEPRFSASGINQMIDLQGVRMTGRRTPLLLRAIFLGEVRQIGQHWESEAVGRWLLELQRLSILITYTSEMSSERAHTVWRTAVADQEIRQGKRKPRLSEEKIRIIHESLKNMDMSLIDAQTILAAGLSDYFEQIRSVARGRRPLLASDGYLGIGPHETEQGDLVFILLGADTPYILRRQGEDGTLRLIGEAYVHGVMDGETMEGNPALETIALS
jgi:hypothetical protein